MRGKEPTVMKECSSTSEALGRSCGVKEKSELTNRSPEFPTAIAIQGGQGAASAGVLPGADGPYLSNKFLSFSHAG